MCEVMGNAPVCSYALAIYNVCPMPTQKVVRIRYDECIGNSTSCSRHFVSDAALDKLGLQKPRWNIHRTILRLKSQQAVVVALD